MFTGNKEVRQDQKGRVQGAVGAQSVRPPTSAQVMISGFVGSGPMPGSVLTAQSLEPALDSVSPSLSAPSLLMLSLSSSLSTLPSLALSLKINK